MNKQSIKITRKDIENWYIFERKKLLTELDNSYLKHLKELSEQCSLTGHEYVNLPNNGINSPNFLTGEWPMKCKYCGVSK